MELWQGIALGLLQGLTEFLPVSSSGHLVIFGDWLGVQKDGPGASVESALHIGTLLAVVLYFRSDVLDLIKLVTEPRRIYAPTEDDERGQQARFVILGSIGTVVVALPFLEFFESLYSQPKAAAFGLLMTALLLMLVWRTREPKGLRLGMISLALTVGAMQGLAAIPGISRSGSTIAVGMMAGLTAEKVGRYSFLLSLPAVTGASALEMLRHPPASADLLPCAVGAVVAFGSGLLAVRWTMSLARDRKLHYFVPYAVVLATVVWLLPSR